MKTVLVVEDEPEMIRVLREELVDAGYAVLTAASEREALALLEGQPPDLVITDLRLGPGGDGLAVLDAARAQQPPLPVILMTAFGAVDSAVEAMKRGAFHYLTKPFKLREALLFVRRALEDAQLRAENRALRESLGVSPPGMVAESGAMRRLVTLLGRAAPSSVPVLISGESGAGKELVARALHHASPRDSQPLIAVNCSALSEGLLESELFGHAKGAFTGATAVRRGLFVEADGGTLFLDEIGDMSPPLQAKLLRALQEKEIRAVGGDGARKVDVRVIAASHRPLEELIRDGRFREDLFYRLSVVQLYVPPLRERAEDLPLLTRHFLDEAVARHRPGQRVTLSSAVLSAFGRYPWPGNVRELRNTVERLVLLSSAGEVGEDDLRALAPQVVGLGADGGFRLPQSEPITLRKLEDEYIAWVLRRCGGNRTRAAELLGVDASTLYRRERAKEREPNG